VLTPSAAAAQVAVSVRDFGCGIPPENLPRIFEPFFTTKALSTRRGTGLGLSMVYELAKKMEAGLAVESAVDRGSTFTLILRCGSCHRRQGHETFNIQHSNIEHQTPNWMHFLFDVQCSAFNVSIHPMNPPTILIVEDDDLQFEIYEEALAKYKLVRVEKRQQGAGPKSDATRRICSCWTMCCRKRTRTGFSAGVSRNCCRMCPSSSCPARWRCASRWRRCRARARALLPAQAGGRPCPSTHRGDPRCTECGETEVVRQVRGPRTLSHRGDAQALFSRSTDALTRQNHIVESLGKSKERPNISALAREFKGGPPHHHPRPCRKLIRRGQLKPSLSRMGESTAGRSGLTFNRRGRLQREEPRGQARMTHYRNRPAVFPND